ncbi:ParA family protein [Gemmiger formicilis]|uniref:ParA family protein n=1 Tax=Gemmiger formicilis TaxID=745368 RepID=UPI003CCA8681
MKTIAIANQKGGTGKTTTAYNLGIALTQQGYRVLMVDFDPQGNLSCYCGIPPEQDLEQTITELLMKVAYEKPLSHRECVYQSRRTDDSAPQVDFIPSNLRLASFELAMGTMMCREVLLKTCLEQYSSQYDYCIIDCPLCGASADKRAVRCQRGHHPDAGAAVLGGWAVAADKSDGSAAQKSTLTAYIRGVLLTMTQHTKVSEHYAHDVRAKYGRTLHVFTTEIPYNVKVQESQAFAPTILYELKSSSARAYVDFTQEVLGHGREEQVYERDEDARDR